MKRILSLILCGLILASTAAATACAEKDDAGAESTTPAVQTEAETEEELSDLEKRQRISDDLPDTKFDGDTFSIVGRNREDVVHDVGIDLVSSADVIEDAIYRRNTAVSERFDIKLAYDAAPDGNAKVRAAVQADDDAYDLLIESAIGIGSAALEGNFLDWYTDLPYVDLDKPWYIGNAKDALSIENHAFIMAGEFELSILRFTYCMYFNKKLATDYNVEDLYALVNNNQWTIDKLSEIVSGVYSDIDGGGKRDDKDLYGFTSDFYSATITYQYAFNNPVMAKSEQGIPEITYLDSKMPDIVEKLNDFYWNNNGSYPGTWGVSGPIWEDSRALFLNGLFWDAEKYRDLDFDFGIIPYPMWDEAQGKYYTMSDGAHDLMAVPQTVRDTDYVSIIIEALNAESYKKVIPAYYEVALKVKYSRDEESVGVLDMVLDGRTFDFGYIYDGFKGYAFLLQDLISTKSTNFASTVKSRKKSAENRYAKVIDSLLGLTEQN